ncbi:hypothetical protein [Achromobacter ruhlandii]|uniref:hypothetical protein n=1 Tax=Achromobacter ruhlandii TaxID=72557 RepID=UPI0007BF9E51|nr:hypothetical protein [Achromobacter ruhlandii]
MKKRYQVGLLFVFGVLLAVFASNPPEKSEQWASWVQAWGSLVAIGVAIWVPKDQYDKAAQLRAKDAKDEVRNFLAGVREELLVTWEVYMRQVGQAVEETGPDEAVEWTWPVPDNPFKVYAATVGMIGRVPEDQLRNAVMSTYIVASGFLLTWEMHNGLRAARDSVPKVTVAPEGYRANDVWMERHLALSTYSKQLRKHQEEASRRIGETVRQIDGFLKQAA